MDVFTYRCTNEKCFKHNIDLDSSDVNKNRKCKLCGNHTIDVDLYDGDDDCKHEEAKDCFSGIKCKKCGGWYCY